MKCSMQPIMIRLQNGSVVFQVFPMSNDGIKFLFDESESIHLDVDMKKAGATDNMNIDKIIETCKSYLMAEMGLVEETLVF